MRAFSLAATLCLAAAALAGCAGDDATTSDEAFIGTGATLIYKSLQHPGNLVATDDRLIYSTAHFVASGDPELDQQFAYWEGALWNKPLPTGARKKLSDTNGAVQATAILDGDLLVINSAYVGVTRYAADGDEEDFYNDYSHFPDEGEDYAWLGGIAVTDDAVFITRSGSEVMRVERDGSDAKVFAKAFSSGWVEHAGAIVATERALFWASEQESESGSRYRLYRAEMDGDYEEVGEWAAPITSIATDDVNVFFALASKGEAPGAIMVVPADSSAEPRVLVADQPSAGDLVYDATLGLFFTEGEKGVVARVPVESTASETAVAAKQVLKVKGPTSIALNGEHLYVAAYPSQTLNQKKGEVWRMSRSKIKP
jgi:hypothetical protein